MLQIGQKRQNLLEVSLHRRSFGPVAIIVCVVTDLLPVSQGFRPIYTKKDILTHIRS